MSVTGYRPENIQAAIMAALVGNTITGTYIAFTLNQAEDDMDPAVGAYGMADGGVAVVDEGSVTSAGAPFTSGSAGRTQDYHTHTFRTIITYSVAGVTGQVLNADTSSISRQILNLIKAGLQPLTGSPVYTIPANGIRRMGPKRHPQQRGFYVQEIVVSIAAFWEP